MKLVGTAKNREGTWEALQMLELRPWRADCKRAKSQLSLTTAHEETHCRSLNTLARAGRSGWRDQASAVGLWRRRRSAADPLEGREVEEEVLEDDCELVLVCAQHVRSASAEGGRGDSPSVERRGTALSLWKM